MIHNGIEYGLMQAYAEGFEILKASKDFQLDLGAVAGLWRHGSVIRSWLLDLISFTLSENPELVGIKGWVADSGEGRWTVDHPFPADTPGKPSGGQLFSEAPGSDAESLRRSRRDERIARLMIRFRSEIGRSA
jgi:6-phosphogluconate dehydrogenase